MFGEVVEGFEVLDKINEAICDDQHRPYQDIRCILHELDKGYDIYLATQCNEVEREIVS